MRKADRHLYEVEISVLAVIVVSGVLLFVSAAHSTGSPTTMSVGIVAALLAMMHLARETGRRQRSRK